MKLYWLTLIAYGLFTGRFVYADDTEIYRNTENRINPNVIFLIDTSGSMGFEADNDSRPESDELSRLDIVRKSVAEAIGKLSTSEPINLAIMRFDDKGGSYGGVVMEPFRPTDSAVNKNLLIASVNSLISPTTASGVKSNIGGGTPLTEAFWEASLYMLGQKAKYGQYKAENYYQVRMYWNSNTDWSYSYNDSANLKYGSGSNINSLTKVGNSYVYNSPVEATCQKNHIVLFTDGAPSSDSDADGFIRNKIQSLSFPSGSGLKKECSSGSSSSCSEELAYWLQNTDHFTDSALTGQIDPNATEVKQPVYIHTVGGFSGIDAFGKKLLNDIALYGHPLTDEHINADGSSKHYYAADNEEALTKALLEVFGGIASTAGNFAAPAVAVNSFNSLEHRDELYYSVFQPSESPGWSGNIKRYRMNSYGEILDANDNKAVNPDTGFFKDTAKSFWSTETDGAIVTKGGIANKLSSERKVYTNLANSKTIIQNDNRIHESNTAITKAMLSGFLPVGSTMSDTDRVEALQWGRGLNPASGLARKTMAEPLHGTPLLVTYRESSDIKDVLYAGTNSGYIHAFNPEKDNAAELWAFMPKEMLPNLAVYESGLSRLTKTYGIDGPMSVYHNDKNRDRIIDTGETAYLTAGMRRGGSHYFLLDISSRTAPKLEGQISTGSSGFEELGQTWSRMTPAKVKWNGSETNVFFFGGGYDPVEDNKTVRGSTATKGNAIYMVTADSKLTGKAFDLLWKASGNSGNAKGPTLSAMKSGFPGDLSPVDNNGDGTVDTIYAADVGGRIWRFDINKDSTSASNFATGGVIADFNDGTVAGNIRFYTQPDISYTEYGSIEIADANNPGQYILKPLGRYQIAIGSGFRANPLGTSVKDKIFVINDYDTEQAPVSGYKTRSLNDLANYDSFASASPEKRTNGFYYNLPLNGEKVLSTTLTVNDVIYVPTFRPSDASIEFGCEPDTGQARLIVLKPATDPDTSERIVVSQDLQQGGIVPKPVLIFPPTDENHPGSGEPVIAIGTEITAPEGDFNAFQKTYWRQN